MIKKILFTCFIFLFYIIFSNSVAEAKEYCHFYVNNEYKETIELPFYFYTSTETTKMLNSWPETTYTISYKKIESITQCESIKKTLEDIDPYNILRTFTVYDYTPKIYTSYTDREIYLNSKLSKPASTIKGFSSIKDEEPPVFSGYKEYYTTNIDSPIDLYFILENISAYDKRDGNVTSNIIIEHNEYETNIDKIGTYPIILSVSDLSENKSSITFYIEIKDLTSPIIEGPLTYISYLSSPININEIKSQLSVKDNVDNNLLPFLYLCEDTYSPSKNKIGVYAIHFCVMDSSYNEATPFKAIIEVKDDIVPIIEGISHYTTYLSNPITVEEIILSLSAFDNKENISSSIFVTNDYYSTFQNIIGEKAIIFQAMDNAGNLSAPFKVTIDLKDDIKPQIFGINTFTSNLSNPLSLTYLKQQLTALDNYDGNISQNIEVIEDSYSTNINNKGTYHISFQVQDYSKNISELFKIDIKNIDNVPPSISGPSTLKYEISNKPTISNILNEYNAYDNVDGTLKINIDSDNYTDSLTTGTYYVSLSCSDSENNKSAPYIIKIEVVDILLNLNEISIALPISKNYTIEEINKIINLTQTHTIIENTYTPNYKNIGVYSIQYKLEDNSTIVLYVTTYEDKINNTQTIVESKQKKETFFTKIKSFFINLFNKIKIFLANLLNLNIYLIFLL